MVSIKITMLTTLFLVLALSSRSLNDQLCKPLSRTVVKLTKQMCYQTCEGDRSWQKDCFEIGSEEQCRRCHCESQSMVNICVDYNMSLKQPQWLTMARKKMYIGFTDVLWIGAHNTGSDKLRFQQSARNKFSVYPLNDLMCKAVGLFSGFKGIREISRLVSRDQFKNIWELLQAGARFLDIDTCIDESDNLRTCHCLYGRRISIVLAQISHWLFVNPTEILILRFGDGIDKTLDKLSSELEFYLGDYLIEEDGSEWPYDLHHLQQINRRVLVISKKEDSSYKWIHLEDIYMRGLYTHSNDVDAVAKQQLKQACDYRNDTLNVVHSYIQRSWTSLFEIIGNVDAFMNKTVYNNLLLHDRLLFSQRWNDTRCNVFLMNYLDEQLCRRIIKTKLYEEQ